MALLLADLVTKLVEQAVKNAAQSGGTSGKGSSGGSSGSSSGGSGGGSAFSGSATGVATFTDQQERIKNQMNANSQAWHQADQAERARLEAENRALASQLGSGVRFDPVSGTWSGSADAPQQTAYPLNDYSDYIREMYEAKQQAALAQLEEAYEKNMAQLEHSRGEISPAYQQARNQAAALSEQQKRNFGEYAAAQGLNSGTGGQAELARSVALQNDLSQLNQAEADALAQLELQRSQTQADYNSAIAQAQADGDYQLAYALYQEKVRLDEALRQQLEQQAQWEAQQREWDYQLQRDQVSDQRYAQGLEEDRQAQLAQYGQMWLSQGLMPSEEMLSAMGLDAQTARLYLAARERESQSGGASSRSSGGAGSTGGSDWEGLFLAAYRSGHPRSFIANNYKSYGFTSSTGLWDEYGSWTPPEEPEVFTTYSQAAAYLREHGLDSSGLMTQSEWSRHRDLGGQEALYDTYQEYLNDYVTSRMQ